MVGDLDPDTSAARARTAITAVRGSENFAAFDSRFDSTWMSRRLSTSDLQRRQRLADGEGTP